MKKVAKRTILLDAVNFPNQMFFYPHFSLLFGEDIECEGGEGTRGKKCVRQLVFFNE